MSKMYDIYEKKISGTFAGEGVETIVVGDGVVRAHARAWNNPDVVDDDWQSPLENQPVENRGREWRKLQGSALENCQAWASEVAE